jgi:glycerophosphoryl diester phosphodiesterase
MINDILLPLHPKIVCHRGAETCAPENTFSATDTAISLGFNIVEIDVRQTKDGVPVVLHDPLVDRTTNGQGEIKKMNYADVCKLDAGSWFDPFFAGERVPRLEDVLAHAKEEQLEVFVDIKEVEPKILLELVQEFDMLRDSFFWSRNIKIMDELRLLNKNVRLMARRYDFPNLKDTIERHNPQVIEFKGLKFTNKELNRCKELGILSMPYYAGSRLSVLKKLVNSGADMLNLTNPKVIKYKNLHFLV